MDVAEEEGWVIEWVFSNVWLTGPVNVNVELQKKEWISRQLLMDIFVTNIGALQKKAQSNDIIFVLFALLIDTCEKYLVNNNIER